MTLAEDLVTAAAQAMQGAAVGPADEIEGDSRG